VLAGERLIVRALAKDPLAHFLAAGLVLFVIGSALDPRRPDDETIVIDRQALLEFIQYRAKAFSGPAAESLLDGMDEQARAALIRDFVREEALAREAAALGLDANDYVIRQRMVQKAEFLAETSIVTPSPTPAEVAAYFKAHREDYRAPASATLTHVFVSGEGISPEAARGEAAQLLERLRQEAARFDDAPRYGDRFLFHKNYVDRTEDYIESQLGPAAAAAIFDPRSPLDAWIGPYRSDYGEHLLYVTARAPSRLPSLSEVEALVAADLAEERRREAFDRAVEAIVAKYAVELRLKNRE
jgi:hypothetical protein